MKDKVKNNLKAVRVVLDSDVIDTDITSVQNKLLSLTQVSGLCAESLSVATMLLEQSRLKVLDRIKNETYPASIMSKMIDAECANELGLVKYADRLNSAITHSIDGLRSVISLYKEEMANNIKS